MRDCERQDLARGILADTLGTSLFGFRPRPTDAPIAWQSCTRIADGEQVGWIVGLQRAEPALDLVVAHARSQLHLDAPDIATSPPRGGTQLVGVPIWFWLDRRDPIATTASIPNLSATLTATPTNTHLTIHDGGDDDSGYDTTLDCPAGGRPWTQGRDDPRADGPCSHTFTDHGTTTIDATVTWTLTWTATNGQTGTLEPIDRTTTFTLTIEEAQAVTD